MAGDQAQSGLKRSAATTADDRPLQTDPRDLGVEGPQDVADLKRWKNLWQIPLILISVAMIVVAMRSAMKPPAPNDFDGALAQVEEFIGRGDFDAAAAQMRRVIEPNLDQAASNHRARFHALAADLTFESQRSLGVNDADNHRHIAEQYQLAVDLGMALSPPRLERWAMSSLALNDLEGTRDRLSRIEAQLHAHQPVASTMAEAQATRNRVFRRLVEASLRQIDPPIDALMKTLAEYRVQGMLAAEDEIWAVARMAEIRLEAGQTNAALDTLLLEMRRLEGGGNFGELYGLLGRAYFEKGESDKAASHLHRALELLSGAEPARGDALVLLARIEIARGELDDAYERLSIVARDYLNTRSHLPGLLGLAEVQSVLGEHEQSCETYRVLATKLAEHAVPTDVTPWRMAASLCDRHDAALTLGNLDRAEEYAVIAERLFPADQTPGEILFRLASTNRQLADNFMASATGASSHDSDNVEADAPLHHEANLHYERAGNFYLRHVDATSAEPGSQTDWGSSLWLAADSFDRAGRQDLALENFRRYFESRTMEDPRRAEALFRLGQAHQARLEFAPAVPYYEQVINDLSRSTFAAQSHVPLARCYLALERAPEAQRQLQQVLAGERLLSPDAQDYRDALIELGRLLHATGDYIPAIEKLTEAAQRYPDDARLLEVRFLLADSYRSHAEQIADQLANSAALSPAEIAEFTARRAVHLQTALETFGLMCETSDVHGPQTRSASADDLLRRAHLYRADCAFQLGQFALAVELYETAARKFSADHSSMYALVQIVNCYKELNDAERAAAAHQRALVRLKQLPDSFSASDALMDRTAWERWLEHSPAGTMATASANAPGG